MSGETHFFHNGVHYEGAEARAKMDQVIDDHEAKKKHLSVQYERRLFWLYSGGILTAMLGLGMLGLGQLLTAHRGAYWIGFGVTMASQVFCTVFAQWARMRIQRSCPIGD